MKLLKFSIVVIFYTISLLVPAFAGSGVSRCPGVPATLVWSSTNSSSCTFSSNSTNPTCSFVASSGGSQSIAANSSCTVNYSCSSTNGNPTDSATLTIYSGSQLAPGAPSNTGDGKGAQGCCGVGSNSSKTQWDPGTNSCITPCVTSWNAVPQANMDAAGITCASVAPYANNLSSYSPSQPTWSLSPAPAQPTKTGGTISATYDSCNINNIIINRSACTCVTSWLPVPQANIDAAGITCASVAPYTNNLSSYSPSQPTWSLSPAPAQPTKTGGVISATYDSCNINNVTINRSACTIAADPSQCGPGSGVTPQLTEPTASSACSGGVLNSSSPADTLTSGAQAWNWSCGTVTSCSAPKYGCRVATDSNYTLPQYGANGPNNNYGCASTCANGESNYPTCTPPAPIAEPTFSASCTLQSGGKYNIALTWNAVSGATNYPVRITNPSGTETDIGMGAVGDGAPTGTSYTFTGLSGAGTYTYWGHAWSSTKGWSSTTARAVNCPAAGTCNLPWGGTIASGGSFTAYQSSSVTSPSICTPQTRTCTNGVLSGTYTNQSCTVVTPSDCTTPWGSTLTAGQTVTAYENDMPSDFCNSETRRCRAGGTLTGSFGYETCTIYDPSRPDLTTGVLSPVTATVGTPRTFSAMVSNNGGGSTLLSFNNFMQVATGPNGGGTITNSNSVPQSALPRWASQRTDVSYTFSSPGTYYARICADKSDEGGYAAQGWGNIQEIDEGNNCGGWTAITVSSDCTTPWGTTVYTGNSVTAYQSSIVNFPATCASQTRTCTNGTLDGSYTNQACIVRYPNLTAGAITPVTATAGTAVTLSANISNSVGAAVATSFNNFIQVATLSGGNGTITDLGAVSMASLGSGASSATTKSYTFPSTGVYSVRACADKTNSGTADPASVTESNENDNCGPWTDINVTFQCPVGQYWVSGLTCAACGNGGCNGGPVVPPDTIQGLSCKNGGNFPPVCVPPATATFTASPLAVSYQGTTTLTWSSTNADLGCVAGGPWLNNPNTAGSGIAGSLVADTTFTFQCMGSGGNSPLISRTVNVCPLATPVLNLSGVCQEKPVAGLSLISGQYTTNGIMRLSCNFSRNYVLKRNGVAVPGQSGLTGTTGLFNKDVNVGSIGDGLYTLECSYVSLDGITFTAYNGFNLEYHTKPPEPIVTLRQAPASIAKGSATVISWTVLYPNSVQVPERFPACKLSAKPVCTNNICTQDQIDAAANVNAILNTGNTDSTDPAGSRRINPTAVNTLIIPDTSITDWKASGKKTFNLERTTDFLLNCGSGKNASSTVRVQVTSSIEG